MPLESVIAAPETKGRLQDAEHDKKLIENIDRVTPFLRKESGHHSSSEQQSRKKWESIENIETLGRSRTDYKQRKMGTNSRGILFY